MCKEKISLRAASRELYACQMLSFTFSTPSRSQQLSSSVNIYPAIFSNSQEQILLSFCPRNYRQLDLSLQALSSSLMVKTWPCSVSSARWVTGDLLHQPVFSMGSVNGSCYWPRATFMLASLCYSLWLRNLHDLTPPWPTVIEATLGVY